MTTEVTPENPTWPTRPSRPRRAIWLDRPTRLEWLLLALIIALAASLRLGAPGISEFKLDEARLSLLSLDMARGVDFPLLGIGSSVGIPNTPVSVWLFAIPYWLSADPTIATLFVGLLNVIAVILTWWVTRRYFGPWAGLAAALLYAASPWGAIYSRKIWAQNLLPPFVLLTVWTGLGGFVDEGRRDRWRWQLAHVALLAITVGIHYGAASLVPLTVWLIWLGRRTLSRRTWIALGVGAVAVIAGAGLAAARLMASGFSFDRFGGEGLGITGDAFYHFFITFSGNDIHSLAGEEQYLNFLAAVPDLVLLQTAFGLAILVAAGWFGVRAWREKPGTTRRTRLALLAWLLLPVAAFSFTWTESFPHYMIPAMPAAYIIFGVGLVALWGFFRRRMDRVRARGVARLMAGLLLIFAALQAWNVVTLLTFLDQTNTTGAFGTPLHYLLDARAAVLENNPDDVLVIGVSDDPHTDTDAAVWETLLYDVPSVRPLDGRDTALITNPVDVTQIAINTAAFNATASDLPANRCTGEHFDLRPGEGYYTVCARVPPEEPPVPVVEPPYASFANGVQLVYAQMWTGAAPSVRLGWAAGGPLPGDFTVFAHLLDASGARVGQQDAALWPGHYWQAGDIVVQEITLPAGADLTRAITLRVGLYTFNEAGSTTGVDILDVAGNPAGQWIDLPLAQITYPDVE